MNETDFEQKYLLEYIRDDFNQKRGMIIAIGPGKVGFCLTHKKDKFNKPLGFHIAMRRAVGGFNKEVPFTILYQYIKMIDRSNRYFKNQTVHSTNSTKEI